MYTSSDGSYGLESEEISVPNSPSPAPSPENNPDANPDAGGDELEAGSLRRHVLDLIDIAVHYDDCAEAHSEVSLFTDTDNPIHVKNWYDRKGLTGIVKFGFCDCPMEYLLHEVLETPYFRHMDDTVDSHKIEQVSATPFPFSQLPSQAA